MTNAAAVQVFAPALPLRRAAIGRWLAVGAASLVIFTLSQDGQMVVSALPRLGRELGIDPTTAVWLMLASAVTSAGLMLPLGRWADASGNRIGFLIGNLGFAGAAALAGLAPNVTWLLGARAIEGAFAALLLVLVITVAVEAAGPENRGNAIAAITAAGTLGSMTGPQLVAVLMQSVGWRAVFLTSVPLLAVAAAIAWPTVPGEVHIARPRARWLLEAIALTAAVTSLFLLVRALPLGTQGMLTAGGLGLVVVLGLGGWSRLPQARGIFRLVAAREMELPLIGLVVMAATIGVIAFAIPYLMLGPQHVTLEAAGVIFVCLAFGQTMASVVGGWAMKLLGSWPVAVFGAILTAIGMLLLVPLEVHWSVFDLVGRIALVGVGSGFVAGCNQSTVMGLTPAHHEACASAVSGVLRNVGYSFGAATAAAAAALAPDPLLGLRVALVAGAIVAVGGLMAALRVRRVMAHVDELDHHPIPHPYHHPVHRLEGLAHDPDHPSYTEPEPLHPRAAVQ